MARNHNTTVNGSVWPLPTVNAVWLKGTTISGYSPTEYRKDRCGTLMRFESHGNRNSNYGWEIDHILPVARGGSDDLSNLQPLQWENNLRKGDQENWHY